MTTDEHAAVQRWKARDEQFDEMLDQIGLVVDRLNPIVTQIGEAASRQGIVAQELEKKAERAESDFVKMNKRIKVIMQTEKNSTFICKLIMFVILLTFLGILAQRVNRQRLF